MKSSYLKRMLLFILVSGMIPVVIFSALLAVLIHLYQNITYSYHKTTIDIQRYQIEEPLKYLEKTLIQLLSVDDMAYTVFYPRTQQYYLELVDARLQLLQIQTYSLNLSDVVLVSLQHNWAMDYSSFGPISMSTHQERIEAFSHMRDPSFWYFDRQRGHIYLVKKLPLNLASEGGMMIADLPASSIDGLLSKSYADFPMVVADAAGVPMLGTSTNRLIVETVQSSPELWRAVAEKGITTVRFNDNVYVFTHVKSDYNNWDYYSIIPISGLFAQMDLVRILTIVLVLLVIAALSVYAVLSSRRLYTPISGMVKRIETVFFPENDVPGLIPSAPLELLPANDELNQKISLMLTRFNEVRSDLRDQQAIRARLFLADLFSSGYVSAEHMDLVRCGIVPESLEGCLLCVVSIRFNQVFRTLEDRELSEYALQNVLDELLPQGVCLRAVYVGGIFYFIQYNADASQEALRLQVQQQCDLILSVSRKYLSVEIDLGVSAPFTAINSIPVAKSEGLIALRGCLQTHSNIVFYRDMEHTNRSYSNAELERSHARIIAEIEAGDSDGCKAELEAYFDYFDKEDFYLFKLELNSLFHDIVALCEKHLVMLESANFGLILDFDIMSPIGTIHGLREHILEAYILPLCAAVNASSSEDAILDRMRGFVRENIGGDSSLALCAATLGYTPNYLSRYFRKNTGKTYVDYVTDVRIELGRKLLTETQLTVTQIAEKVGYPNAQNLIRMFKRATGLTPRQYRDQAGRQ